MPPVCPTPLQTLFACQLLPLPLDSTTFGKELTATSCSLHNPRRLPAVDTAGRTIWTTTTSTGELFELHLDPACWVAVAIGPTAIVESTSVCTAHQPFRHSLHYSLSTDPLFSQPRHQYILCPSPHPLTTTHQTMRSIARQVRHPLTTDQARVKPLQLPVQFRGQGAPHARPCIKHKPTIRPCQSTSLDQHT